MLKEKITAITTPTTINILNIMKSDFDKKKIKYSYFINYWNHSQVKFNTLLISQQGNNRNDHQ